MTNLPKPAILGGTPAFSEPVPVTQPTMPTFDSCRTAIEEIFRSGMITNSTWVQEFESQVAEYLGVKHVVAVNSCTGGLMLAWRAQKLQGQVVLPSFTFPATAHALIWNGFTPRFADIDPDTLNLDTASVEEAIGPDTVGILAVHTFGNPATPDKLEAIAKTHGLKLVFDSAHAIGSTYQGRPVGAFGDAEVFSLSPTKLVVAAEGGLVTTDDDELARQIRIGRDYGNPGNYDTELVGLSARMEEINAVIAIRSLEALEENLLNRRRLADLYQARLDRLPGLRFQKIAPKSRTTYKDFPIIVDPQTFGVTRDELGTALAAEGITTRKYFYPPVHEQQSLQAYNQSYTGILPGTKDVSRNILCVPMYSHMEPESAERICSAIERIYEHRQQVHS